MVNRGEDWKSGGDKVVEDLLGPPLEATGLAQLSRVLLWGLVSTPAGNKILTNFCLTLFLLYVSSYGPHWERSPQLT